MPTPCIIQEHAKKPYTKCQVINLITHLHETESPARRHTEYITLRVILTLLFILRIVE
jgi:hypothetical protein